MKNKFIIGASLTVLVFLAACGGENTNSTADQNTETSAAAETNQTSTDDKGVGKFTKVELTYPLDQSMVTAGKGIYDLKCGSCHRLTSEKLVGPGWKDVTKRRKAEWIMNFATNAEEMLSKDPTAMALLEECLVRMPNQNLSDDDARHVYEYMRSNDGEK